MDLYLYGEVLGNREPSYDERGVSYICPEIVREALTKADGEDITLYVNSFGGDMYAGINIKHMLKRYKGHVTAIIDGIGASAGSMLTTGADTVKMYQDTQYMLHFPWTVSVGNADDFRVLADHMEKTNEQMKKVYAERFNGSEQELHDLLNSESFLTAEEAYVYGFCDEVIRTDSQKMVAKVHESMKINASDLQGGALHNDNVMVLGSVQEDAQEDVEDVHENIEPTEEEPTEQEPTEQEPKEEVTDEESVTDTEEEQTDSEAEHEPQAKGFFFNFKKEQKPNLLQKFKGE